jgi:nucleoside phosphorylase
MPLELDAVVAAFGLEPAGPDDPDARTGRAGGWEVTALHVGMGPATARAATARLFDAGSGRLPVEHVMVVGICGGLHPDVAVGTLVNPETVVEHTTGATYRHVHPAGTPGAGSLITTEGVHLDLELSQRMLADGFLGVDMESSAVAEVCEAHRCPWSVYRCISDRAVDGLLDDRILALTRPDGSVREEELIHLLAAEPEVAATLDQLARDSALAARLAAEEAFRGLLALDA